MTFRYGQRHGGEIEAARRRVRSPTRSADHVVVDIDLRTFGGSALTADVAVPKDRDVEDMLPAFPSPTCPARNTIFLSFALAWAEVPRRGRHLHRRECTLDYSSYPDWRPEYIAAYERMANLRDSRVASRSCECRAYSHTTHRSDKRRRSSAEELGTRR